MQLAPILDRKTRPQANPIKYSLLPALIIFKIQLLPCPIPLHPDSCSFSTIIGNSLLEPLMLEGLLGGKTLLGIIDKDTAKKVEELLIECCSRGNDLLQQIQLSHR